MESKEIAGIAVAFSIIAAVLLVVSLFFLIRHRSCISRQASNSSTNPTLSTIWVRKEGSNGNAVVGMNGNNNDGNGTQNTGYSATSAAAKDSLALYEQTVTDPQISLTSNGQYHSIKVKSYKLYYGSIRIIRDIVSEIRFNLFPTTYSKHSERRI